MNVTKAPTQPLPWSVQEAGDINDNHDEVWMAGGIAETVCEIEHLFTAAELDALIDVYVETYVGLMPESQPERSRSPIEMMVDRACGIGDDDR